MTIWRPHQSIRFKAIGLAWQQGRLLAAEVVEDCGRVKGVRPLGGTIEFGETWQDALKREFHEELKAPITITSPALVFENIYQHQGHLGHEVIFAADITLPDRRDLTADKIVFHEDNGVECTARWFALSALDTGDLELYPTGLKAKLLEARC